jgi:hypothetical protein
MMLAIFAYQNSSKRGRMVSSVERDEGKGSQQDENAPASQPQHARFCRQI